MKMKRVLFFIFLLPLVLLAEKFTVETIFRPAVVNAGEPVEVILISNKRGELRFDLPEIKGGRWLKNYVSSSTQTSIVNGVVSVSVRRTIPIMTEAPGVITIPPFTVKCGKETASTRELVIKVLASGDKPDAAFPGIPDPFGEITLPSAGRDFYVGEEIPLELSLFIPVGLEVRELSYPELTGLGNAVLIDYSKINPRNRFFAPPVERRRVIGNNEYTEILFRTSFRALKAENAVPGASASVGIVHRTQRRTPRSMFDDDFFDGFFSSSSARIVPKRVVFKFTGKPLEILPLPPLESGAGYLNLVGSWQVSVKLGSTTARVGEPVELTVSLTGTGSAETLEPPPLQIPGFRIYPPEVKRYPDRIEIKYAMIPLETGERKIAAAFAVFDPVKRKYVTTASELILPVSQGNAVKSVKVSAGTENKSAEKVVRVEEKKVEKTIRQELFYQKKAPGKTVELPLFRNQLAFCILLLTAGIFAGVFFKLRDLRRERAASDVDYRRKHQLHSRLKTVLSDLKQQNYSEESIRITAVPFLAESIGMSPGTTPEELAEKIDDPELAGWLRALNSSGFMPGSTRDAAPTAARIRSLIRMLKKCGIWFVVIGAFSLHAGFNSAFDSGNYAQAEQEYRKFITDSGWSANALYNLGAVYFMQDDLPKARLYFMRALLIDPDDAETLENLNLVNRKLMQSETGSTETPSDLLIWCRDRLRPDQYILAAVLCASILLVLAGLKGKRPSAAWYWSAGTAAVLMMIFISAAAFQMAGPYSKRNAVVIVKTLKIRSLPVASGKVEASVAGGGTATVIEKRDDWSRILINGRDGWVRSEDIETVFPGGLW